MLFHIRVSLHLHAACSRHPGKLVDIQVSAEQSTAQKAFPGSLTHPPPTPYHPIFLSYRRNANHRLTSLCIVFYLSETSRTSRKNVVMTLPVMPGIVTGT